MSVFCRLKIEVSASCQVDVCVNFGNHLQNSMWTGNSILVGDGREGRSYPFSTPDCICHEFAHCLTDSWSGLLMNGQAGGINDAFSDAFSQVRERDPKHLGARDPTRTGWESIFPPYSEPV